MISIPTDIPFFVKNLVYGDPGAGKSEYVATYVDYLLSKQGDFKPVKCFMFDPYPKATPYLRRGSPSAFLDLGDGTVAQMVTGREGQVLFELEYYFDMVPQDLGKPGAGLSAYERFQQSLRETEWSKYSAVCLDSLTGFRNAVIRVNQFKVNATTKGGATQDGRQWYGAAGLAIQNDVMSTLAWAPCHTFILAHVDVKTDEAAGGGAWYYAIMAPGQLSSSIASVFSEVYHLRVNYSLDAKGGKNKRLLLTEHDGRFIAQTHIGAPQLCEPTWEAVTRNIRNGQGG